MRNYITAAYERIILEIRDYDISTKYLRYWEKHILMLYGCNYYFMSKTQCWFICFLLVKEIPAYYSFQLMAPLKYGNG